MTRSKKCKGLMEIKAEVEVPEFTLEAPRRPLCERIGTPRQSILERRATPRRDMPNTQ